MKNEIDRHCYIILNNHMVEYGIKYEIGKIYEIPEENGTCFPKIFYGIDELDLNPNFNCFDQAQKLFEIKILKFVSKKSANFKIMRECNYKEVSKRKHNAFERNIHFNEFVSAVKLNDEKILDKMLSLFLESDCRNLYGKILIKSNVEKYQEILLNSDSILAEKTLSLFSNRNKILDELIKIENRDVAVNIIRKGINKYLDFYMKEEFEDNMIFNEILKQGRFKDIDCFLNSKSKNNQISLCAIISTGIDKYLDYAMELKDPFLYR